MSRRSSTLNNSASIDITREIASKYDNVKAVSEKLTEVETVANADLVQMSIDIQDILDFTDITVVTGTPVDWNAGTKVLTIPQGDKGDTGTTGNTGDTGSIGDKGDTGDAGISIHHLKSTTTNLAGDFAVAGEVDTHTFWGDAGETANLGSFSISNGSASEAVLTIRINEITALAEGAAEWSNADEDVLISAEAGGDQIDDYSSKHYSIKAAASEAAALAAVINVAAAEAAAISTAADLVLTNADVVLTNADVVSTGNDVTTTQTAVTDATSQVALAAAEVVLAAAEKDLAAAQVALAVVQANNAATSATTAAGEVVTAQQAVTDATAQVAIAITQAGIATTQATNTANSAAAAAADLVQTDIDQQATAADVILTNNNVTATNADVVSIAGTLAATNADVIITNADVVLTNADVVLTNADVALTNADVVTTNADAATVAGHLADFQGQYYGPLAVAPTVGIDQGDLYFDTTDQLMKVRAATTWENAGSTLQTARVVTPFTATQGQTAFTGLTYDVGFVDVVVNGVFLRTSDFTATDGSSVNLVIAAELDDEVDIVAYAIFSVANHYLKSEADALLDTKLAIIADQASLAAAQTGTNENTYMPPDMVHAAFNQYGLGTGGSAKTRPTDANDITIAGFYVLGGTAANRPPSFSTNACTIQHIDWDGTLNNATQIAVSASASAGMAFRYQSGGTWQEWNDVYHPSNILGTVSQSAGVPTGAIIQSGGTAIEGYIRYADGTQIVWGATATAAATGWSVGTNHAWKDSGAKVFPASFSSPPRIASTTTDGQIASRSAYITSISVSSSGITACWFATPVPLATFSNSVAGRYIAIGRWFA